MPPGAFQVLSIVGMGGGMISFRVRGGAKAAESFCKFCKASKLFTLAENLGGVESLCETPARMTHGGFSREARQAAGVFDDMIRLSVGIEGIEDLKKDILSALEEACTS
ncbi:cystathionine gamma-lyase cys3 [Orbilia oligospora]|uniref:cystathionine gamma-lyase n=1 Tax=Orbilia oligospora TaxID=2813651 RepID=A0A7C8VG76_ORBOL|nr:cystathionine gamma-lyase cys3 [Orbilia oligospora]